MSFLQAIILGIVQGISEFLPVSSFGHIGILRKLFGISGDFGTLFSAFLHMGTLIALILVMKREVRSFLRESIRLCRDLLANFLIYLKNRRSIDKMDYVKLIKSKSRKFTVMIWVGTIPTLLLAYFGRHLVFIWSLSSVWPAIGFLMTGIVLLVAELSKAGGNKGISETTIDQAMWIGITQGLSIFAGISRCALVLCVGLFFGYTRKYALRYTYLLTVPAVLGSFLYELSELSSPAMGNNTILYCIAGMIFSALTGFLCIRFIMKIMYRIPLWIFSVYSFLICIAALVYNFQ